jgi:hypothetical protein
LLLGQRCGFGGCFLGYSCGFGLLEQLANDQSLGQPALLSAGGSEG